MINVPHAELTAVGRIERSHWERADLSAPAVLNVIEAIAAHGSGGSVFHEPAWLLEAEERSTEESEVYVLRQNGAVLAYAPFIVQPWSLRFRLGELTLFSVRLQRLHINNGPVVGASELEVRQLEYLFVNLRARLAPGQAIYVEGVSVGGAVDRALVSATVRKLYRILEPSPRYERQLIRFPESFDAYMQSLKPKSRQTLRSQQRKLEKHLAGDLKLVTCTAANDVPAFVKKASDVSRRTYQWHLLGLGLRDTKRLERTLIAMAERGWTRCYLLECKGKPVAFMLGYLYRGTYYYVDVGFDPGWAKWSVGTILHLEVFRDLLDGPQRARLFDFSSGTGIHKERFGNEVRPEANYLLLPQTTRNAVLAISYRAASALADGAVHLADRLGVKVMIKKLLRRRSIERAAAD